MLIPFKKEHLEVMDMRQHEREVLGLSKNIGTVLEQSTVARTGVIAGQVVACGGVNINVFGSGDVWLIPSIYLGQHSMTYLRLVRDWLESVRQSYEIKRFQTACINDELHNKYMSFLGFEKEGEMRHYALEQDYCMWGKVYGN